MRSLRSAYFMSGLMFSSVFLALLSPVPLIASGFLPGGRKRTFYLVLTNAAAVGFMACFFFWRLDWRLFLAGAVSYLVSAGWVGYALPLFLSRPKVQIERSILLVWLGILAGIFLVVFGSEVFFKVDWVGGFREIVAEQVQAYQKLSPEKAIQIFGSDTPAEFQARVLRDLPVSIALLGLIFVVFQFILSFRMNVGGWREKAGLAPDTLRKWKSPEWLIWPVITIVACAILAPAPYADQAVSALKAIGAIYVLQGLSVLSFAIHAWKLKGFLRFFIPLFLLIFLLPFMLGLGFFDLWFDFRSKLRQT